MEWTPLKCGGACLRSQPRAAGCWMLGTCLTRWAPDRGQLIACPRSLCVNVYLDCPSFCVDSHKACLLRTCPKITCLPSGAPVCWPSPMCHGMCQPISPCACSGIGAGSHFRGCHLLRDSKGSAAVPMRLQVGFDSSLRLHSSLFPSLAHLFRQSASKDKLGRFF